MRNDAKEPIRQSLRDIAIARRSCILFDGDDQNEVDEFIRQEGARQFEKADELDKWELLSFMLNEIIETERRLKDDLSRGD